MRFLLNTRVKSFGNKSKDKIVSASTAESTKKSGEWVAKIVEMFTGSSMNTKDDEMSI